jgi:hypothetical protein
MKELKTETDLGRLTKLTRTIPAEVKRLNNPMSKKHAKKLALDKLGLGPKDENYSPTFRAALCIQDDKR